MYTITLNPFFFSNSLWHAPRRMDHHKIINTNYLLCQPQTREVQHAISLENDHKKLLHQFADLLATYSFDHTHLCRYMMVECIFCYCVACNLQCVPGRIEAMLDTLMFLSCRNENVHFVRILCYFIDQKFTTYTQKSAFSILYIVEKVISKNYVPTLNRFLGRELKNGLV